MNIQERKKEIADALKEMRTLIDHAEERKRPLTKAEEARYSELDASIDVIKRDIQRAEKLQAEEAESRRVVNPLPWQCLPGGPSNRNDDGDAGGFRNIGEYFYTLAAFKRDGRRDDRLDACYAENREQSMATGSAGGFAVPSAFDATVRQVTPQDQLVRPRATVIPAGNPPDALLTFPTLDQTSSQNMYGGVVITHSGEGVTMSETSFKLREGSLEPKELSAYIAVTNKLLLNWEAGNEFITRQLQWAVRGTEDYDMLRGDGVNKCVGIINSAASIAYSRTTPNTISFSDVVGMLSRVKMGGSLVWAASQTVIPQLAAMVDAGNHAVWLGGANPGAAANAAPSTLLGFPLMFVDRMPALGTKGDLCLLNLPYYLVKDGSGPMVASSEHILFLSNKTVFKVVWNVDGRPWLTEPITLEGTTSNTVSPFVVLS
jgi:HK97 family phage major capsid protein